MAIKIRSFIVIMMFVGFSYCVFSSESKYNILSKELVALINGIKPRMTKDELTAHVKNNYTSACNLQGKEWSDEIENYFEYMLNENISFEVLGLKETNKEGKIAFCVSGKPKIKVRFILTGVNITIDY